MKRRVVCLCGSTKFKDEFMNYNQVFTGLGNIVLMPGIFAHADNIPLSDTQKEDLDNLHKFKIDLSDFIFIINKDGYIGSSTLSEIEYAKANHIPVYYMEEHE